MSKFAAAMNVSAQTWNGAPSYASPDPSGRIAGRVGLFFKGVRGLTAPRLYQYLRDCARENLLDTFLLAFHLRDCRGGKGERTLGRQALTWLFVNYPDEFSRVLPLLPEYGRWDDLLALFPGLLKLTDLHHIRANYDAPTLDVKGLDRLRSLQTEVVDMMAKQMKADLVNMNAGKPCSLCAKWTPTEGDSLDRRANTFRTLATAMGVSHRTLRKVYNTALRSYLKVVELYICSGRWSEIEFNRVPSHAMKRLKKAFEKHDDHGRFIAWRDALKLGKPEAKVNAKQLHPHELVREVRKANCADAVTEAQWKVLIEEVRKLGSLGDSVAVVDVSGSMESPDCLPLDVAVAMGMCISDVVQGAFHGHVITFHHQPTFTVIPDGSMYDRWRAIRNMSWGGNTNLALVFQLILDRARVCNLKQEDMPKRLFIISDMQFDCAVGASTNWEHIEDLYQKAGYTRPQIVFWNVNGSSTDFPVTVDKTGTAMISGFSPSILKALLHGEELSPLSVVRQALDDVRYEPVRKAFRGEVVQPAVSQPAEAEYDIVSQP